jgi:hypothetical protein
LFGRHDRRHLLVRILRRMIPFVFPNLVELPVIVEVAARAQGAQAEHGFSPLQAPASARDIHPVVNKVPAGPFHNSRGDRQASGECLVLRGKLVQGFLRVSTPFLFGGMPLLTEVHPA